MAQSRKVKKQPPESDQTQLNLFGQAEPEPAPVVEDLTVPAHVCYKYACKQCEGVEDDGPTVKSFLVYPHIISKGIATPGLLAHILVGKPEDAPPVLPPGENL